MVAWQAHQALMRMTVIIGEYVLLADPNNSTSRHSSSGRQPHLF